MKNNELEKIAGGSAVTIAELLDLQSVINRNGNAREGGLGLGKHQGMKALVNMGANTSVLGGDALTYDMYKEVMALGPKSSDPYVDISLATTLLVPVNIVDPDQTTTTWTLTDQTTYVAGLLTTNASDDGDGAAVQTVTLTAGKYRLSGGVNRNVSTIAAKLTVSGATDSTVLTKTYSTATISADDSVRDDLEDTFTLAAASQVVTFTIDIKTIATGLAAAGAASLRFILESV